MKKYLLLIVLLPAVCFAQVKSKATAKKPATKQTVKRIPAPVKPADAFLINGTITGYPDGTNVDLLNANNGMPEVTAKLADNKFTLSGKMQGPDFKLISVNSQPVYIPLFLDNSVVTIVAQKDSFDHAVVKGSPSHNDFTLYNTAIKPYEKLFMPNAVPDEVLGRQAAAVIEKFVQEHPSSYITPLAIFRHNQLTSDNDAMERMFNGLSPAIKASAIGNFISQQIAEAKKNPIGKPLAEFSQEDTSGKSVALSSFKGKYVLVDFWASWCGPCRQENPNLVNVYNRYKDKNFTVLGVSLDKAKQPWIDAIKMDALTWTHVSDLRGWNNAVAQQFQIFSIPQNFLLDTQGNVVAKNLRGAALESKLSSILK